MLLTVFLKVEPMDTFGALEARTWIASPVWGLRAVRALRSTRSNDRKPESTIF